MAIFNSNLIIAGQQVKSVYPGTVLPVYGNIAIPASTTLSQVVPDTLQAASAPGPSSHLVDGWFNFPILDSSNTLRMSFGDGTNTIVPSTAITTWNAAQRFVLEVSAANAMMGNAITYSAVTSLYWSVATTSGAATAASVLQVYFCLFFAND